MINFEGLIKNKRFDKQNQDWPSIPDHSYRILIIENSRSGKINYYLIIWKKWLFNLINQLQVFDKIYLYAKDPYETKYHFF